MIKKIVFLILFLIITNCYATQMIRVYSPYSPAHSGTPAMLKILNEANQLQDIYKFVLEFKPGGNQIIAIKSIDEYSLSIIAPAFVDNIQTGKIKFADYVPVHALGNACWAVIVNKSLQNEIIIGGVGLGNASHLTGLMLAEKYKFQIKYIVFRSNNDALVNMAGDNGINMVIDRYESFESMKQVNSNLKMLAASCPSRLPQEPNIKTLKELGVPAPYIFNITVAHRNMPAARRQAISQILNSATIKIGSKEIYQLSAMRPPIFDNIPVEVFYQDSVSTIEKFQTKYRKEIATQ